MAFRLYNKQSAGWKCQEDKQLNLSSGNQALETSCFESISQLLLRVE